MDTLLRYHWPGNVRELMNAVERAVVLSRSEYLGSEDLPLVPAAMKPPGRIDPVGLAQESLPLDEVEKAAIMRALETSSGNKSEAARRLGITRKTLLKKLRTYGVA